MFFKEKGFYISLVCGVAAIAAVAGLCMNLFGEEEQAPTAVVTPTPEVTAQPTQRIEETASHNTVKKSKETVAPKATKEVKETGTRPIKNELHFNQET